MRAVSDVVLIYDLEFIVVDVFLVDEGDIFRRAVVAVQDLDIIVLYAARFFVYAVIFADYTAGEKLLPFAVRERITVQLLNACAQISDEVGFRMYRQIFVFLLDEQSDEFFFKLCLALVSVRTLRGGRIFGDDSAFGRLGDYVVIRHFTLRLLTV